MCKTIVFVGGIKMVRLQTDRNKKSFPMCHFANWKALMLGNYLTLPSVVVIRLFFNTYHFCLVRV